MTTTTTTPSNTVYIFAEGSASPKSKTGGWGAVLTFLQAGQQQPLAQLEMASVCREETTHHRMVLVAAIEALEALTKPEQHVVLVSGSKYLVEGLGRLSEWKAAGWKTASGKALQHQDLWEKLAGLASQHRVGTLYHTGHRHCARASALATKAREEEIRVRDKHVFSQKKAAQQNRRRTSTQARTTRKAQTTSRASQVRTYRAG